MLSIKLLNVLIVSLLDDCNFLLMTFLNRSYLTLMLFLNNIKSFRKNLLFLLSNVVSFILKNLIALLLHQAAWLQVIIPLHYSHFLLEVSLQNGTCDQLLKVVILALTASAHSCELQLKMNQMSEFILLTNMKHLLISVIFPLVKDANKSTFEVLALVHVEKTVVEHCGDSFTKLPEVNMNRLLLLE